MAKSKGNMYKWVSHTVNPLAGACMHGCSYCYINNLKIRSPIIKTKYSGIPRLSENGMNQISGNDKMIFVTSMADLFAENVPTELIIKILKKCSLKNGNKYLFQTKNPKRLTEIKGDKNSWFRLFDFIPDNSIIAITMESDIHYPEIMRNAPTPQERFMWFNYFKKFSNLERHITIEPILDFDFNNFLGFIQLINPAQVNIGFASGNHNLPEPSKDKVLKFILELEKFMKVIKKKNEIIN